MLNSVDVSTSKVCTLFFPKKPLQSKNSRTDAARISRLLPVADFVSKTHTHSRAWTRPVRWPTRTRSAVTFSSSLVRTCLLPSSTSSPPWPNASRRDLLHGFHRRVAIVSLPIVVHNRLRRVSPFFRSATEDFREKVSSSSHFARFCGRPALADIGFKISPLTLQHRALLASESSSHQQSTPPDRISPPGFARRS